MIPRLKPLPAPDRLYREFLQALSRKGFEGDLTVREGDRLAFATDNSIYQLEPQAIAFPRHAADVCLLLRLLAEERFRAVKLAPRGGGTGTNGQSLTDGLVVDLSRHMNRILEIDPDGRWARVQCGVVKDQLNRACAPHGLFFAPELSTSNRATIGGMIGTDASGQGSCVYGKTRDHVQELTTALLGGHLWHSHPLDPQALARVCTRDDPPGRLHRSLREVAARSAVAVREHTPRLSRSVTGYDLAHLQDASGRFDLNALLCGSEGTLGIVCEAKLNLVALPRCTAVVGVRYASFDAALRHATVVLQASPAAIETMDSTLLRLARSDAVWSRVSHLIEVEGEAPAQGLNMLELTAQDSDELARKVAATLAVLSGAQARAAGCLGHFTTLCATEVAALWTMRKRAVGILGSMPGARRPVPFVEDIAVPPARLADFIGEFRAILDAHGLTYGMFGHVDAGVLHVRPALDMADARQARLVRKISDAVEALARRHGGVLWGEHGKGFRSEYMPAAFGPLYPFMQQVKAAFDPWEQLNPGKIAASHTLGLARLDEVPLRGQRDRRMPLAVRDASAGTAYCNGNGACHNVDPDDAMCPSWKASGERRHSPKGRASLMRDWLGRLAEQGMEPGSPVKASALPMRLMRRWAGRQAQSDFSHEVYEAMGGCLGCKACATQCPLKVNIPQAKAQFLNLYHTRYARPAKDHAVAALEHLLPLAARVPGISNALAASAPARWLAGRIGLVDIPRFGARDPMRELRQRYRHVDHAVRDGFTPGRAVLIVQDIFTSAFEPQLVLAVHELVHRLGFEPLWCAPLRNGKPLHVHGFLARFERAAHRTAQRLGHYANKGIALVGIDPSMTMVYRDEYRATLGEAAPQVLLLQEWLARHMPSRPAPSQARAGALRVHLFAHCNESVRTPTVDAWREVFRAAGVELQAAQVGCCGMAGTYGHEAQHQERSRRIFDTSWAPRMDSLAESELAVASGYSCRAQARRFRGTEVLHPAQLLLQLLSTIQ